MKTTPMYAELAQRVKELEQELAEYKRIHAQLQQAREEESQLRNR